MNYCSSCGQKLSNMSLYCPNCGTKLKEFPSDIHNELAASNESKAINSHASSVNILTSLNQLVQRNPLLSIIGAVILTVLLVSFLIDSPEEALEKTAKSNEEHALHAAEDSVKNQIESDGFTYIKMKEISATMTREENINLQKSGIYKITGTAILKDMKGKKHDDIPFQLYVDFYDGEFYAQQMVDIRYGYPLMEQF